ncbi:MAG: ATP-binding protein [Candidatus Kapabacteria bacterium]|jgi:signal transduction histidine kinase/HAMP domain-containing protein|nr:ATP-binding protein [Candidatus Kapabacteria bacterium]
MQQRFTLNAKLLGFALLLVLFTIIVAFVSLVRGQALKTKNDVQLLYVDLLKAHTNARLFLRTRRTQDLREVRESCTRFRKTLLGYPNEWFTTELLLGIQRFSATSEQIGTKIKERGYDENSGTEGAFRRNAHKLQNMVEELGLERLNIIVLETRRREKDYFLRNDTSYATKVRSSILSLLTTLSASGLALSKQQEMQKLAFAYLQDFERTVLLLQELMLLEQSLDKEFEAIEPIIRRIETLKQEESSAQEQQTLVITLLSIIVSIIAAFTLARRIAAPIVALQQASRRLSEGDYSVVVTTTSNDEIADLGRVFNSMTTSVREHMQQLNASYSNLRILSSIGRNLSSSLETERIVDILYHNLIQLIDVDVFAIGIYNEQNSTIEDILTVKDGQRIAPCQISMASKNSLAVWCLVHQNEVYINDYANEYSRYVQEMYVPKDIFAPQEFPQSLLFIPLLVVDKAVGVLTVQCFRRNAISTYQLDIIRTLAAYLAAALNNAHAFATVQEQNSEILRQQELLEEQAATIQIANTELQEQNVQLEALNQEKNEFLGIAAHDLKNPLTSIQLNAALIMQFSEKLSKEETIERAQIISLTAQRMSEIITNLLDINAIESGKLNFRPTSVDIVALTHQIADDYQARAAQKQILLHIEPTNAESAGTYCATADLQAMTQILDNLISNAVKYSPLGKQVWVRVTQGVGVVRIQVQDEGPGISQEEMSKLFGKFVRLSARPTAGEQSNGLGLSIVKRMAEAMNGRVWCESEIGKGAKFIVEIPSASKANA